MTLKFNTSVLLAAASLLTGFAHADDNPVTLRTVTVDGYQVDLPYTRVFENGQEVLCQTYVKDVVKAPAQGKIEITLGTYCNPESAERFTL